MSVTVALSPAPTNGQFSKPGTTEQFLKQFPISSSLSLGVQDRENSWHCSRFRQGRCECQGIADSPGTLEVLVLDGHEERRLALHVGHVHLRPVVQQAAHTLQGAGCTENTRNIHHAAGLSEVVCVDNIGKW